MPLVVTTEWLRELVPTKLSAEEIAERLSDVGLAVDVFEPMVDTKGEARLELEAPTNRGDCWSMIGVARELAAALGKKVKPPKTKLRTSGAPASKAVKVKVEAPDLCPRYTARVIRGVKVGPSPEWMQRRLEAVGIRPISNVVDVTNYVLVETGQPLHAFDMALLSGEEVKTIVVRRARDKEKLPLLDETTRELTTEDLVIADSDRAVALAGVMGGADTEICSTTTEVLLESAQFNQISTRRTSRRHGAVSESSIRFEHGVDPVGVELASRRAARLLAECADGKVAPGVVGPDPAYKPRDVTLRHARVARLLGSEVPDKDIVRILKSLGLEEIKKPAKKAGKKTKKKKAAATGVVTTWRVPSWRQELGIEVDLIEEIARVYGYNRLPGKPTMRVFPVRPNPIFEARKRARDVLTGLGYTEVVGASLFAPENASLGHMAARSFLGRDLSGPSLPPDAWKGQGPAHRVVNPARAEDNTLRTSLFPSLLTAKLANQSKGRDRVRLFEVAPVCLPGEAEASEFLAVLDDGLEETESFKADDSPQSVQLRSKGALQALLEEFRCGPPVLTMGVGGSLRELTEAHRVLLKNGGRQVGIIGLLSPDWASSWGIKSQPGIIEIDLAGLVQACEGTPQAQLPPVYPCIARDVALVLDEKKTWEEIEQGVRRFRHEWHYEPEFNLLSVYRGEQIGPGKKSIAFRVVYQAPDRTLTDEDVKGPHDEFVQKLCAALGATLRQ